MEFNYHEFKKDLIIKRLIDNSMSMDEASKEIGISKATLSRIERGSMPDMVTFLKVCEWLGTVPMNYFIIVGKRSP